jgi:hypothetical protein
MYFLSFLLQFLFKNRKKSALKNHFLEKSSVCAYLSNRRTGKIAG